MSVVYRLESWDGSEWNFGAPGAPAVITAQTRLGRTPTGVGGGAFKHVDQANRGQAGVTWYGMENEPTFHELLIRLGPMPPGDPAVAYWHAWRHALGRGAKVSTFYLTSGGGGERFQRVRQFAVPNQATVNELWNIGYAEEVITLRSDETWFRKAPATDSFVPAEFATATIANLGNEPSWPKYKVFGPITNPVLGIAGESVTVHEADGTDFTIANGNWVEFQTDPQIAYIRDQTGAEITWNLSFTGPGGFYTPAPVDPDPIALSLNGIATGAATKIDVELPQLYWFGVA